MNLFVLTPEEKRVVAFVMLMILVGVGVKEYRKRHPVPPVPIEVQKHPWMRKLPPLPSVTPENTQPADGTVSSQKRARRSRKPKATPPISDSPPANETASPAFTPSPPE